MRCKKFQDRIGQLNYTGDSKSLPNDLFEHRLVCPKCSEFAKTTALLTKAISLETANYDQALMPIEKRLALVAARTRKESHQPSLIEQLSIFIQDFGWGRGRLTVAISTAAVMLALFMSVPFGYDRVIGYNLSLAGVCPEVAADDETMCDLLLALGIEQPAVDVIDCDVNCSMILSDLKSEAEIELAIFAMADLGAEAEIMSIDKIVDRGSASLWEQAHSRIFSN